MATSLYICYSQLLYCSYQVNVAPYAETALRARRSLCESQRERWPSRTPGDPRTYGSVGTGARAPIRPSEAERIDRFPGGSPPGSPSRPVEPRASRDVPFFAVSTRDRVLRNTFARMLRVRGHSEQGMDG